MVMGRQDVQTPFEGGSLIKDHACTRGNSLNALVASGLRSGSRTEPIEMARRQDRRVSPHVFAGSATGSLTFAISTL